MFQHLHISAAGTRDMTQELPEKLNQYYESNYNLKVIFQYLQHSQ